MFCVEGKLYSHSSRNPKITSITIGLASFFIIISLQPAQSLFLAPNTSVIVSLFCDLNKFWMESWTEGLTWMINAFYFP